MGSSGIGNIVKQGAGGVMGATIMGGLKFADKKGAFGTFTKGRKQAQASADQARQDATNQQASIDAAVTKLNTDYGVGDSAEAQANKTAQDAQISTFGTNTEKATADQVNQGYQDATTSNRQNLARSGLLNSSVDVGAQRANLAALIAGRQKAVQAGQGAARDLRMTTDNNRLNIVSQVQNGTIANPDFNAEDQQRKLALDSATANVVPSAIGEGFTAAGSLYDQNQNALDKGGGYSLGGGQPVTTPSPSGSITK